MAISFKLYIEIPILLIFFCFMLSDFVTTNFIIYRTCYVTLGYNKSDCVLLGTNNESTVIKDLEAKVQPVANVIMMTKTCMEVIISVFFSLIAGPWSNKHGRKPILISSFTGYFFTYILLIILSLMDWISPWWWLLCCFVSVIFGGICSMLTVSFCYIADTSTENNRGIRMGILEGCFTLGALLGTISCSYIFNAVGYTGLYGICAGISFLSILYTYFLVPESIRNVERENKLRDFIDISVILTSIKTCFKRRPNMDRVLLGLIMSMLIIYIFVIFSDSGIFFMYIRKKFNWSLRQYSLFSALNSVIDIVGAVFILLVLHKFLKINDIILILFGFVALCTSSLMFGFATTGLFIYIGSGIKRLSCVTGALGRSAISKLIPPDDLGHVFAFTTSLETIVQIVSSPLYTILYNKTIFTMPSAFNFISAFMYGINILVASAVIVIRRFYPNEDLIVIN